MGARVLVPDGEVEGLLKYHREARKMTTRKTRTWGMLMDCSAMVALVGGGVCVFVL